MRKAIVRVTLGEGMFIGFAVAGQVGGTKREPLKSALDCAAGRIHGMHELSVPKMSV